MSTFEAAIPRVLAHESGDLIQNDNGRGPSKWGITLLTAREFYPHCSPDDICRMTPESAAEFYRMAFWSRYRIGLIDDQALATELLDLAVNMGGGTAVKLLQRAVRVTEDGILGAGTARAVNALSPASVLSDLKAAAEQHYRDLAAANPEKYAKDLQGWLNRLKQA